MHSLIITVAAAFLLEASPLLAHGTAATPATPAPGQHHQPAPPMEIALGEGGDGTLRAAARARLGEEAKLEVRLTRRLDPTNRASQGGPLLESRGGLFLGSAEADGAALA